MDLPGPFPMTSAQGHACTMIMCETDLNAIQDVPIKNRKKAELDRGHTEMTEELKKAGIIPVIHRLDNEKSIDLIKVIED